MYFQRRGDHFSFVYYDSKEKRNRRLPLGETPEINSEEDAEAFCDRWNKKHETSKARISDRMIWVEEYPEFSKLLSTFATYRREDAEYSWQTAVDCLKYYIFPFYLTEKKETNVDRWPNLFEEFREYLKTAPTVHTTTTGSLAVSSINGVIKAFNAFLIMMHRRKEIKHLEKCRLFSKSKCNIKGEESVIDPTHQRRIYQALQRESLLSADMFLIGLHTGMRINELAGISLNDFFHGFPDGEALKIALKRFEFQVHGFISLASQPVNSPIPRIKNGTVPRKPLKQKKRISAANSRTIPILDPECFNTLVRLWNDQQYSFQQQDYGSDPGDYLLFRGVSSNIYYNHLLKVQRDLNLKTQRVFTPHDTRHTYSTWLAEKTGGDFTLCKMILGHSSLETTMGYVHMGARIHRQLKAHLQLAKPMAFISLDQKSNVLSPGQFGLKFERKRSVSERTL